MAVEKKGVSETVTKWINGKINEAGYAGTAITIRSDQEEATVALKKSAAIYRRAETVLLESPVRDSTARVPRKELSGVGLDNFPRSGIMQRSG